MMMTNSLDIARRIAQLYYPLSNESLAAFADILVCRKYKKGVRILDEGEVCKSMLFIEKGMTRQFYFKYGNFTMNNLNAVLGWFGDKNIR